MRHSSKPIFAIALLAALAAGCSTVTVAPTAPPAEAPYVTVQRSALWHFNDTARPIAETDVYRSRLSLTVFLLVRGELYTAAASVRDGLLAGYYGERRTHPEIRLYDTANI